MNGSVSKLLVSGVFYVLAWQGAHAATLLNFSTEKTAAEQALRESGLPDWTRDAAPHKEIVPEVPGHSLSLTFGPGAAVPDPAAPLVMPLMPLFSQADGRGFYDVPQTLFLSPEAMSSRDTWFAQRQPVLLPSR